MRRRTLLAASGSGSDSGLDTWLKFPLYFDFDYCEFGFGTYCTREPDDTSIELVNLILSIADEMEWEDGIKIIYPKEYGMEIYFRGILVTNISILQNQGTIPLYLDGSYEIEGMWGPESQSFVLLRQNGEFFTEM